MAKPMTQGVQVTPNHIPYDWARENG